MTYVEQGSPARFFPLRLPIMVYNNSDFLDVIKQMLDDLANYNAM